MKIKTWIYYTFSATCFTISAVINYLEGSNIRSVFLFSLSGLLFFLALLNFRKKDEVRKLLSFDEVERLEAELSTMIAEGNKIEAINKYRQITGLTLLESKEYIESILVSKEDLDKLDIELRDLIFDGKKYKAVKRYREVTCSSLQDANKYVESLM